MTVCACGCGKPTAGSWWAGDDCLRKWAVATQGVVPLPKDPPILPEGPQPSAGPVCGCHKTIDSNR